MDGRNEVLGRNGWKISLVWTWINFVALGCGFKTKMNSQGHFPPPPPPLFPLRVCLFEGEIGWMETF